MVLIVETGISLMELECLSIHLMLMSMSSVELRLWSYVVGTTLTHQLSVYIAVTLQLMLSMMILPTCRETQSMWDCILPVEVPEEYRDGDRVHKVGGAQQMICTQA